MNWDAKLREDSGYDWVMARLETASPFGAALARQPRWYGPGQEAELERELERVENALGWARSRTDGLIHLLSELRDIRNTFRRPAAAPMDVVELLEVKHFLLRLEALAPEYASDPLDGIELAPMGDVLDLLDPAGRRLPTFHIENAFDPALERIRREKARVEQLLRETPDGELRERRAELAEQERTTELNARRRLTTALLRERERFQANMDAIGRLDLVLAKAALARKYGCTRPVIGPVVRAQEMLHPRTAEHVKDGFTPVSLELERGAAVITGANMGGKSVSLKAVTLNLLLMHTGFFVFARRLESPLFHSVGLIGADGQSVERGLSSFGAEVRTLDETLKREEGHLFFLALDEFARGTNPREGAALARALVKYLNTLDCVALMTTHYDGVAPAARRHYQVAGLDETARRMDYRLIPAAPDAPCPRDALKVCRLLGLDGKLMACLEENS